MYQLIGIAGQLGYGKDALADYLVSRLNEPIKADYLFHGISDFANVVREVAEEVAVQDSRYWHRTAFANAVKEVYQNAFDVDRTFIEKWKRNPEPPPGMLMNVRKSLQFIGDGFRQIKGDIWVEIALRGKNRKVLSDSRYINEARAVKARDGYMILLWRPGFENDDPNPSESQIRPIIDWCVRTEQNGPLHWQFDPEIDPPPDGIRHYDFFMRNDGSLNDLYAKIDQNLLPLLRD